MSYAVAAVRCVLFLVLWVNASTAQARDVAAELATLAQLDGAEYSRLRDQIVQSEAAIPDARSGGEIIAKFGMEARRRWPTVAAELRLHEDGPRQVGRLTAMQRVAFLVGEVPTSSDRFYILAELLRFDGMLEWRNNKVEGKASFFSDLFLSGLSDSEVPRELKVSILAELCQRDGDWAASQLAKGVKQLATHRQAGLDTGIAMLADVARRLPSRQRRVMITEAIAMPYDWDEQDLKNRTADLRQWLEGRVMIMEKLISLLPQRGEDEFCVDAIESIQFAVPGVLDWASQLEVAIRDRVLAAIGLLSGKGYDGRLQALSETVLRDVATHEANGGRVIRPRRQ